MIKMIEYGVEASRYINKIFIGAHSQLKLIASVTSIITHLLLMVSPHLGNVKQFPPAFCQHLNNWISLEPYLATIIATIHYFYILMGMCCQALSFSNQYLYVFISKIILFISILIESFDSSIK